MGRSKAGTWVGGTVVVALLILVAGWFLLVSPVLAAASETRATAASVQADNIAARQRIETLKAQFATLDEKKAELATLQAQVPTTGQLSDYLRQLDAKAIEHQVVLTSVTPGSPELYAPTTPVPAAPAATDGEASTEGEASTDTGTVTDTTVVAAPVGPTIPAGMIDVPVTLTAVGTYANVMAWVESIQERTDRLLLVSSVNGISQEDAPAGGGKPQTTKGDLEVSISGFLYVLPDLNALLVEAPVDGEVPAELPVGDPNRNPLLG